MTGYKRGDERVMRVCDINCGRVSWVCEGEVVRCRDCEWFDGRDVTVRQYGLALCRRNCAASTPVTSDGSGFCAWAKRKGESDER